MVIGVKPALFKLAIGITVVPTVISVSTNAGDTNWKLPVKVSPIPSASVPTPAAVVPNELIVPKLDSKTLPSEPATAPSPKPTTVGTPTIVIVSVVVALSPSLSVIS